MSDLERGHSNVRAPKNKICARLLPQLPFGVANALEFGQIKLMQYRLSLLLLGVLSNLVVAAAESPPPIPLPQRTNATPVVDGRLGTNEYAYTFLDAKTGIRVSWQADQEQIYVGLISPATGGLPWDSAMTACGAPPW
jgi:hypothetical protein